MPRRRRNNENSDHDYLGADNDDADNEDEVEEIQEEIQVEQQNDDGNIVENDIQIIGEEDEPVALNPPVSGATNEIINVATPSPAKKRKRLSLGSPKSNTPKLKSSKNDENAEEDEDDGLTCPICLDNWEMSGEHRLVSLRCGHLFGEACIKRWLTESGRQSGIKACPQCKTKASNKDIRCLYAKRIRAVDRSEEHRLRDELNEERLRKQALQTSVDTLQMSYTMVMNKIKKLESENERMKYLLKSGAQNLSYDLDGSDFKAIQKLKMYKLFMERNIEICRQAGCRVLIHAPQMASLIVTQKSFQSLFPGYGLRFVDIETYRATDFMFGSTKLLRDICLSADQQSLGIASMETRAKLFDLRTRQMSAAFVPGDKTIWACAMDRSDREHFLYLGSQHGSTYVHDVRFPDTVVEEFKTEGDLSPVINIAPVSANKIFPNGGFLVCKLQSVWFFEYESSSGTATATRLSVEGPFLSMSYDNVNETLLFSTRSSSRHPQSRYIVGKLAKIDGIMMFNAKVSFFGSKATPMMTRCSQIAVELNTLVAGYNQDTKFLSLYDVRREHCVQTMPVQEIVYDTCPLYLPSATYLAALTETKCRIYKLQTTT